MASVQRASVNHPLIHLVHTHGLAMGHIEPYPSACTHTQGSLRVRLH